MKAGKRMAGCADLAEEFDYKKGISVEMLADEDGYAPLGEVANLLVRKKRDFDPRNFGFSKLSKLVKALPRFEVDVRQGGQSNMKHFFVRDKERK